MFLIQNVSVRRYLRKSQIWAVVPIVCFASAQTWELLVCCGHGSNHRLPDLQACTLPLQHGTSTISLANSWEQLV